MCSVFDSSEELPDDDPEVVAGMKRWRELQDADVLAGMRWACRPASARIPDRADAFADDT